MEQDVCYFTKVNKCICKSSTALTKNGYTRINNIIDCSKIYADGLHEQLERDIHNDSEFCILSHKTCVSVYTLKKSIESNLKRAKRPRPSSHTNASPPKRSRRSVTPHFDFQLHCFFCGEICSIEKDTRNPNRWRRAFLCRTLGTVSDFKDDILQTCTQRGDKWANDVKTRLAGAVSDLHAADARYHVSCKATFMTHKPSFQNSEECTNVAQDTEPAFEQLCGSMVQTPAHIWNTVELFETYTSLGGEFQRRKLMDMLNERFGEDLLVLSAEGVASLVVFKANAPKLLKVVNDHDEFGTDRAITVTRKIKKECKGIETNRKTYPMRLDKQAVENTTSDTLMQLLSELSPKLQNTPPTYLIGNIITSILTNFPTQLQIALGVLMRNSKALVNELSKFRVTCNHDEVLRFKKAAAKAATSLASHQGISDSKEGLVQVVVDNFDTDISSQNGKLSTHSLAVPENKAQLIALIVSDLCENISIPGKRLARKLVVTGDANTPIEITKGLTIERNDLSTSHEEADNIIAQQTVMVAKEKGDGVIVVSDDTDVFALLLHHYLDQHLSNKVVMESPSVDIAETVHRNKDIIPDLLAAHAISGSDTTACYFGIGKGTVLKVLKAQNTSLSCIGDEQADFSSIVRQATSFISHCYNVKGDETEMSRVRQKVWSVKVGKASACAPKLATLPPTSEAFVENVKRAHLQACVWKHALDSDPPNLEPTEYGWNRQNDTRTLIPVMLPRQIPVAPESVLKMIRCSCDSQTPCSTLRCRCNRSRLSCTLFCACQGDVICSNEQTVKP